jgi:hypothetical protein
MKSGEHHASAALFSGKQPLIHISKGADYAQSQTRRCGGHKHLLLLLANKTAF